MQSFFNGYNQNLRKLLVILVNGSKKLQKYKYLKVRRGKKMKKVETF